MKHILDVECIPTFSDNYNTVNDLHPDKNTLKELLEDIKFHVDVSKSSKETYNNVLYNACRQNDIEKIKILYEKHPYIEHSINVNRNLIKQYIKSQELTTFFASKHSIKTLQKFFETDHINVGQYLYQYKIVTSLPLQLCDRLYNVYFNSYSDMFFALNNNVKLQYESCKQALNICCTKEDCIKAIMAHPAILNDHDYMQELLNNVCNGEKCILICGLSKNINYQQCFDNCCNNNCTLFTTYLMRHHDVEISEARFLTLIDNKCYKVCMLLCKEFDPSDEITEYMLISLCHNYYSGGKEEMKEFLELYPIYSIKIIKGIIMPITPNNKKEYEILYNEIMEEEKITHEEVKDDKKAQMQIKLEKLMHLHAENMKI